MNNFDTVVEIGVLAASAAANWRKEAQAQRDGQPALLCGPNRALPDWVMDHFADELEKVVEMIDGMSPPISDYERKHC